MTYRFELIGAPRTKGNSRVFGKTRAGAPVFLPSPQYRKWFKMAMQQRPVVRMATRILEPLTGPVHVMATFYRDRAAGDLDNFKKGLGDYLQRAGLLENDRQIVSWDGSRLAKDAARPRVEVEITTLRLAAGRSSR